MVSISTLLNPLGYLRLGRKADSQDTEKKSVGDMEYVKPSSSPFVAFPSRRSVVHSTNGIVSCTQPLAAQAGLKVLRDGGNAAVSLPSTWDGSA